MHEAKFLEVGQRRSASKFLDLDLVDLGVVLCFGLIQFPSGRMQPSSAWRVLDLVEGRLDFLQIARSLMAFHGFIDNLSWWIWASCCALDLYSFHLETCSQVQPGESLTLWKAVLIFCRLHYLWMAFHGFIDNLSWWIWASCCALDLNSFHLETCSQVPGSSWLDEFGHRVAALDLSGFRLDAWSQVPGSSCLDGFGHRVAALDLSVCVKPSSWKFLTWWIWASCCSFGFIWVPSGCMKPSSWKFLTGWIWASCCSFGFIWFPFGCVKSSSWKFLTWWIWAVEWAFPQFIGLWPDEMAIPHALANIWFGHCVAAAGFNVDAWSQVPGYSKRESPGILDFWASLFGMVLAYRLLCNPLFFTQMTSRWFWDTEKKWRYKCLLHAFFTKSSAMDSFSVTCSCSVCARLSLPALLSSEQFLGSGDKKWFTQANAFKQDALA